MNESKKMPPVLVGGVSEVACTAIGELLRTASRYECFVNSKLLCHPFVWSNQESFSDACGIGFRKGTEPEFLSWVLPEIEVLHRFYYPEADFSAFLHGCNGGREMVEKLFRDRLLISGNEQWTEATPENLYVGEAFLDSVGAGELFMVVQDGRSRVPELIDSGFSPKAACKIWSVETNLILQVYQRNKASGRVTVVRVEDILAESETFVSAFAECFNSEPNSIREALRNIAESNDFAKILRQHHKWSHLISSSHLNYMLGTSPVVGPLSSFAGSLDSFSGSELQYILGYEETVCRWEKVSLSKEEQQLRNRKSKFLNVFADFQSMPVSESIVPANKSWRFWKNSKAPSSGDNEVSVVQSSIFPTFKRPDQPTDFQYGTELIGKSESLDVAVVIAFLGRHQIVEAVVRSLSALIETELKIGVFLGCSNEEDFRLASRLNDDLGVYVKTMPNTPLGSKWQDVIDFTRKFNPGCVVITGSDDFISPDYLEEASALLRNPGPCGPYEFVAPASWFLYDIRQNSSEQGTLWELAYLKRGGTPLGAGRVYSSKLLDRIDWKIFDVTRNSGLDVEGYEKVMEQGGKVALISPGCGVVLSVKGDWDALNSTEKILSAPTIQSRVCDFERKSFFENHFNLTPGAFRKQIR